MMRESTMIGSVRRFVWLATLFVIGAAILSTPCVSADNVPRVVVLGEVQGAYESAVKTLLAVGLVDDGLRWSGGDAILIQTGDLIDDGIRVREVMDLFMRLQEEAEAAGGQVIVLLGNHEALNILGMRLSVNYETYQTFADENSAARQAEAVKRDDGLRLGMLCKRASRIGRTVVWYGQSVEGVNVQMARSCNSSTL